MKLLLCRYCCDWNALSWGPRECECGKTGGKYNPDGDTATVWGDGILFGFNNRAWKPLMIFAMLGRTEASGGRQRENLDHLSGSDVLWLYDESNGKITRLDEKPDDWKRPAA